MTNKYYKDKFYDDLDITRDRVVLHSDLNNFFASVETLFQPSLKDVPMAVCGSEKDRHGIILAKNEKAKRFGIKTGEPVVSAREKCPNLVTCQSHYNEYVKYSRAVREVYLKYTPNVEPFGIDEAWLDVSAIAHRREGSLFENAEIIANEIKKAVFCETGLRVSVGVSFNKIYSKLASDMKKNGGTTVISPDNYMKVIGRLPVRDLLYVGRNTETLLKQNRLFTMSDIVRHKRSYLGEIFGKKGENVWDFANGFDFSPVASYTAEEDTESVSNSRTLPYDVDNIKDVESVLFSLCESVVERIRARKLTCGRIGVSFRRCDLTVVTRQQRLKKQTDSLFEIYSSVSELFRANSDFSKPLRGLGVSLENFQCQELEQISVFDSPRDLKRAEIDKMLDKMKLKHGDSVICRASALSKKELSSFDKKHPAFNHNL